MQTHRIEANLENATIWLYAAACVVGVAWLAFTYGAKLGRAEGLHVSPPGGMCDAEGGV